MPLMGRDVRILVEDQATDSAVHAPRGSTHMQWLMCGVDSVSLLCVLVFSVKSLAFFPDVRVGLLLCVRAFLLCSFTCSCLLILSAFIYVRFFICSFVCMVGHLLLVCAYRLLTSRRELCDFLRIFTVVEWKHIVHGYTKGRTKELETLCPEM